MNRYQVFIASSLRIQEHREAASKAINAANEDDITKQYQIEFGPFRYENTLQKVEKNDAQEPTDNELKKSTLFFLIIDDVIRSMTQHEFYVAYEQFKHGGDPQYIFILYNGEPKESNSEGLSYKDFMKTFNLVDYVVDCQFNIVLHSKVYAIPFTDIKDLQERIKHQLLAFVSSKDRPFSGALRSYMLEKKHFFTDKRRKEIFPDAYLRRGFDDQLDSAISEGKRNFVALIGHSLSGKTRAVMEAMKAVDDGWVYIVKMEDAVTEFGRLVSYLSLPEHQKLYVVLDDYDQWAGQELVSDAFDDLFGRIWGSNDVIVATASSKNCLPDKDDQKVEWIEIKEMDEREIADARDFFVSAGAEFEKENLRYHRTGALFVNLKDIKAKYSGWLNQGDDLSKVTKKALLKAIKALSIWRDDNIGNRALMKDLATWFCKQKKKWTDDLLADTYDDVLNDLIHDKSMGVTSAGEGAPVIVQEYIYRYFIDYDGSLLKDGKEFSSEKEMVLVRELLLFCSEDMKQETLTAQVSRICRRCAYKKKTVSWLYKLWSCEDCKDSSDIDLSKLLNDDRKQCENTDDELLTHFYSNLIETYIYNGCNKLDDARTAFESCPEKMRTDHLFSALMRKAKPEEREDVRNMPDYTRFKGDAYVIAVEVEWAESYKQAEDWMRTYILYGRTPREMAVCVGDKSMRYNLLQLRRSVTTLALKVSNSEELKAFCKLVTHLYPYLTDNVKWLKDLHDNQQQFSPKDLTRIDQLAVVLPNALASMVEKVFGGDLTASEEFVKSILGDVKKTLDGQFTDGHALRLTFGYAVSKLIKDLADVPYDEVYSRIFKPLKTKYKNKTLILCNIYTYTAMLSNNSCDMQKANNLLMTDLHQHMQDKDNPLTLNTISLNKILEKSSGKNRDFNVDMINKIYDKLHKKRDSFTYRHLLSASTSLEQALGILKEMQDRKVKPNIYTLCALMKQPYIKLRTALTMLSLKDINLPCKLNHIEPIDEVIDEEIRERMSDTHIAWGYLLKKECRSKKDKEVMAACLSYLEKKKRELLEGGYVYNCLISNESYFPFANDVMNFVREKKRDYGFCPDSFTANYLIDRITHLNGNDRKKAIDRLNDLLELVMEKAKCKIDYHVVNSRLRIFRKQSESLKMDFYDEQGTKILSRKGYPLELSVIRYLMTMSKYNYSLDLCIPSYLAIEEGLPGNPYKKLIEDVPGIEGVLDTPSEHNKMLLWQFKAGEITIDYAFENLDWTNEYAAICIFSEILNCYIDSQPRTQALFQNVTTYYKEWIAKKQRFITSITLSVLAKATTCWEDMKWILDVFKVQHKKNPNLSLTSQILSAMSGCVSSVQELEKWSGAMVNEGCLRSSKAADSYVRRMVRYLLQHDHDAVAPILDNLCKYIIGGSDENDTNNMLVLNNSLMLDLYKDQKNISPSLLCSLIYYNATETKKYTANEMIDCIKEKYYRCIIPLMEMLVEDATDGSSISEIIACDFIPQLFLEIDKRKTKRPSFSAKLLSFLAYGLSKDSLDNYRQFLKQLYEMDCREIDGAVPGLAAFLKDYVEKHPNDSEDVALAHKALAQIIVYTKLETLRNRHLLLEEAPEEYAVWCQHLMDCETMLSYKDQKWESLFPTPHSWSEFITVYANRLDDAYPCSLVLCKKYVTEENPINKQLSSVIRQQEHRYAIAINKGNVYFKNVLKLPLMWFNDDKRKPWKWKPSQEIILAMFKGLSRMAWDIDINNTYNIHEYKNDAQQRYEEIMKSYDQAFKEGLQDVTIDYKHLGKGFEQKASRVNLSAFKSRMSDYGMYLDRMVYICSKDHFITEADKKNLKTAEIGYAKFIEREDSDIAWLQQLPGRWGRIMVEKNRVWAPCEEIVLAIFKKYIKIASEKGEAGEIANQYIKRVKNAIKDAHNKKFPKARISYSMLGVMEDKDYYLLVPLKSLSKIIWSEQPKNPAL